MSREGRSTCEDLHPGATNRRLSMTGHRQSVRAGVPTRPRRVSRHGRVAVNRPRSRGRRSERDATRLSAPRCPPGIEWRTPTIKFAAGVWPYATSRLRAGESPPTDRRASPHPQSDEAAQGGVVDSTRSVNKTGYSPTALSGTVGYRLDLDGGTRNARSAAVRIPCVLRFSTPRCCSAASRARWDSNPRPSD